MHRQHVVTHTKEHVLHLKEWRKERLKGQQWFRSGCIYIGVFYKSQWLLIQCLNAGHQQVVTRRTQLSIPVTCYYYLYIWGVAFRYLICDGSRNHCLVPLCVWLSAGVVGQETWWEKQEHNKTEPLWRLLEKIYRYIFSDLNINVKNTYYDIQFALHHLSMTDVTRSNWNINLNIK